MKTRNTNIFASILVVAFSFSVFAAPRVDCLDERRSVLPVINETVLQWKRSTPNQTKKRAHVGGKIVRLFSDKSGHHHFEINIGSGSEDTLEVIYNDEFGQLGDLNLGSVVEACGDYITATKQSGPYPPSPSGAIIHWVHRAPNPGSHPHGFLVIDGVMFGWGAGQR